MRCWCTNMLKLRSIDCCCCIKASLLKKTVQTKTTTKHTKRRQKMFYKNRKIYFKRKAMSWVNMRLVFISTHAVKVSSIFYRCAVNISVLFVGQTVQVNDYNVQCSQYIKMLFISICRFSANTVVLLVQIKVHASNCEPSKKRTEILTFLWHKSS